MRILFFLLLGGLPGLTLAQDLSGALKCTALNVDNQPLAYAQILLFQGDLYRYGGQTDEAGELLISPIEPGVYRVELRFLGNRRAYHDVLIRSGQKRLLTVYNQNERVTGATPQYCHPQPKRTLVLPVVLPLDPPQFTVGTYQKTETFSTSYLYNNYGTHFEASMPHQHTTLLITCGLGLTPTVNILPHTSLLLEKTPFYATGERQWILEPRPYHSFSEVILDRSFQRLPQLWQYQALEWLQAMELPWPVSDSATAQIQHLLFSVPWRTNPWVFVGHRTPFPHKTYRNSFQIVDSSQALSKFFLLGTDRSHAGKARISQASPRNIFRADTPYWWAYELEVADSSAASLLQLTWQYEVKQGQTQELTHHIPAQGTDYQDLAPDFQAAVLMLRWDELIRAPKAVRGQEWQQWIQLATAVLQTELHPDNHLMMENLLASVPKSYSKRKRRN